MINKPQLRFKGFFDIWEQYKLGDIGSTYTGLSGKTKEDFGHGDASYVTYMNIFTNPVAKTDAVEHVEIDNKQNEVKIGDVFFTTSSETPDEVGMSSVWVGNKPNIYLNSFCFGYRPSINIDCYYLAYLLRSNVFRNDIVLLAQGISRYNISKNMVMDIPVRLPSIDEQSMIGSCFKNIDNLIVLQQRKYNNLVNIKKTMLKKMFPKNGSNVPEIRFKEFNDAWEQRKLGESVLLNRYKQISAEKLEKMNTGSGEVYLMPSSRNYCWRCHSSDVDSSLINNAEVITVGRARNANTKYCNGLFIASQNHIIESYNLDKINTKFLYYFILQHDKEFYSAESTYPMFTKQDFDEILFNYPNNIAEQRKIIHFLENIDNLITLYQRKIDKLNNIKKAFLGKMFI